MHQHLKFNILTNKIDEWQPILATEYIGTMYMVYIKFCEEYNFSEKETNNVICKFYIQNYRGSIKMGLGDIKHIDIKSLNKDDINFDLIIPIVPFHNCNESAKKIVPFPPLKLGQTTFETEIIYKELPPCIFNPNNLQESKFIHPLYCYREGDNMHHIYYKENIIKEDDTVRFEISGGNYDKNPVSCLDSNDNKIKVIDKKSEFTFRGAQNSPTCDAKRSNLM